jgi:hypothetical protein
MRILFASHYSPDDPQAGPSILAAMARLRAAGHHVHVLVVDGNPTSSPLPNVRRVVCSADHPLAPIHFAAPSFDRRGAGRPSFAELSDRQLSDYRDVLRIEFDREIDLHDPHVVHTSQLWLFAHLALEAGVPYVASTTGEEFETCRTDARYRRFVVQAAENAGRILTHGDAAHAGVLELVGELEGRVRPFALPAADSAATGTWWQPLPAIYRETFVERFGQEPE